MHLEMRLRREAAEGRSGGIHEPTPAFGDLPVSSFIRKFIIASERNNLVPTDRDEMIE